MSICTYTYNHGPSVQLCVHPRERQREISLVNSLCPSLNTEYLSLNQVDTHSVILYGETSITRAAIRILKRPSKSSNASAESEV